MEKIYEHIVTTYNTDFYKNSNSLEPIQVKGSGLFADDDWSYTAKSIGTKKHPHFEFDSTKGSLKDEESFTENYGNPLCGVQMSRRILCVERTDEKVAIKLFFYTRLRKPGKPYFVKSTVLHFITYNYKTNSLYTGSLTDYHLKKKCRKSLRRVSLAEDVIEQFKERIKGFFHSSFVGGEIVMEKFDTSIPIKKFVDAIPDVKEFDSDPKYTLYKHFLTSGGVKLPNNWKGLIEVYPQPKKIHYKKAGFKYVDAFMLIHNIKGDKLKRVLHKVDSFNVTTFGFTFKLFGNDFMLSLPDNDLQLILDCDVVTHTSFTAEDYGLTKSELKNVFCVFKEVCKGNIDFTTLLDHFNFKSRLLKYQPVKWKSKTLNDFIDEHDEWSKLTVVNDDLKITRVQTKAKRNSQPDNSWMDVLTTLDKKVNDLNKRKVFTLPEKIVEYKLGLGTRTDAIIYNNGSYSTIIWEERLEKIMLENSRYDFQHDYDDLPL